MSPFRETKFHAIFQTILFLWFLYQLLTVARYYAARPAHFAFSQCFFIYFFVIIFIQLYLILTPEKFILVVEHHLLCQFPTFYFLDGDAETSYLVGFQPFLRCLCAQEVLSLDENQYTQWQDKDTGHTHHNENGDICLNSWLDYH